MKNLIQKTIVNFVLLALIAGFVSAQEKSIRGVVISSDSIPLMNAEVAIKGSALKVMTDSMGNFLIACKPSNKIRVQAEGFSPLDIKASEVADDAIFVLKYDMENTRGNNVIYDSEKMKYVILVNNREIDISSCQDIFELFQGRVPGVDIMTFDDQEVLVIRGISTFDIDYAPLVVIDNLVIDKRQEPMKILGAISPYDIKSIDVIKDGASLAIYGSQGSNGVIKIRTKRGLM